MLASRIQADEPPVINMTPMVDVILCLLVFFMAATRLYDWDESEFVVNVPEVAEAAPATAAPDDLVLTVDQARRRLGGGHDLRPRPARHSAARGPGAIRQPGRRDPRRRTLAYQDLADVLSACDEAGIRNVRLPVRSRDERSKTAMIAALAYEDRT